MKINVSIEKTKTPRPRPKEDSLGFGKYFSDHMFIANFKEGTGWFNPRITPYSPISLDPGAAVFHYGQAIFEGLKAFYGIDGKVRLFRPDMNFIRMQASADRLCMKFVDQDLFIESLRQLVKSDIDWVPKIPGTALYIRPTLIGSESFLGVRPSDEFVYYVIGSPVGAYYGENVDAVKIWVEMEYSRAAPGGIGATKAGGNYASSLKAAMLAKKNGFAQVLWVDSSEKRYVEEVGTMNVFFKIGDEVLTPPLAGTILPGVTRDSAISLLQAQGVTVVERPIELEEVIQAHQAGTLQEVFGSGTAASITPVGALGLGDRLLEINNGQVGPISKSLFQSLNDIQYGRTPDALGWTLVIN